MANEIGFERSPQIESNNKEKAAEVVVFQSEPDVHAYNFDVVFELIRTATDGTPRVVFIGDGSGDVAKELESLPKDQKIEVVGVGQYNRMREHWTRAVSNTNYVYEAHVWGMSSTVDYVIVQDISAMESTVLQKINSDATDMLKIGGVLYMRDSTGEWVGYMKDKDNFLKEIRNDLQLAA